MEKRIIIGIAIMLLFGSCHGRKNGNREINTQEISVTISKVCQTTFGREVHSFGLISTENERQFSFKTSGIIKRISVKEGDAFNKGELLAELDMTEINAQIGNARENFEKAQRDYKRTENLQRDSVASTEQLQNARTQLNIAEEALEVAQYNSDYSCIKAPSTGVVTKRFFNAGEITSAGTTVLSAALGGDAALIVKVTLPVNEWKRTNEGDPVSVRCDAYPSITFNGIVNRVSHSADLLSGLYPVDIKLNTGKETLTVGMFAEVTIHPAKGENYFTIPVSCLTEADHTTASVYLPKANTVKKIAVEVAFIQDGTAYISKGLEKVEYVINEGAGFLTESSIIVLPK